MRRPIGPLLTILACTCLIASAGCTSQAGVATRIATDWVTDSTSIVTGEFVDLVVGDIPFVSQLARSVLEDQIRDSVTWEFSTPECGSNSRCEVVATASVEIVVDLPLAEPRRFTASLPFNLLVDTERRELVRWVPDLPAASVRERPR